MDSSPAPAGLQAVLIVGAGPTGLLLALWLTKLGIPVRIIDKSSGPGETSRAVIVHARTLEYYRQLRISGDALAHGSTIKGIGIHRRGRLVGGLNFRNAGAGLSYFPFAFTFPQDQHEKVLVAQLAGMGVYVERRTTLTALEEDDGGIFATSQDADGLETTFHASCLVGCDGSKSTVRELSGIAMPGGTYDQRFFVADADVRGKAAEFSMNPCFTGTDFCLVLPLPAMGSTRLIGVVPDGVDREDVRFEHVEAAVKYNTELEIDHVRWFATYRVHHRVAERFRRGRVFIAGDAGHLHSPAGGQGMNTGLGDVSNLAWKLAAVLTKRANPALLDTYEPERMAFAHLLVDTTDWVWSGVTNRGWWGWFVRIILLPRILSFALWFSVSRRAAFSRVSQIMIEYRASELSQGGKKSAKIQPGDRLPWVEFDDGTDNHAMLDLLDWQVHVYGGMSPDLRKAVDALGIVCHEYPWTREVAAKGFVRHALYLVRPDGHVGFVDTNASPEALEEYLDRWEIELRR
ncbi:hypothetical protein AAFC00_007300 [Neodothiora populina]|uniref:FAD-binding domain-containing protein n=1 Tax=Neodothiora populina TaxID=2781224 RepID=A0ABR3PHU3_9PEZI